MVMLPLRFTPPASPTSPHGCGCPDTGCHTCLARPSPNRPACALQTWPVRCGERLLRSHPPFSASSIHAELACIDRDPVHGPAAAPAWQSLLRLKHWQMTSSQPPTTSERLTWNRRVTTMTTATQSQSARIERRLWTSSTSWRRCATQLQRCCTGGGGPLCRCFDACAKHTRR